MGGRVGVEGYVECQMLVAVKERESLVHRGDLLVYRCGETSIASGRGLVRPISMCMCTQSCSKQ